jgi:hypothetical protein
MKRLKNYFFPLFIIGFCLITLVSSCKKIIANQVYGTWHEINNTEDMELMNCEFIVNKENEEVSLCGFKFIQPSNSISIFSPQDAKLNIKDGRISYKQFRSSLLWIIPIAGEEHHFIDYAFDGDFLWIIGNDSDTWTNPVGVGRVFIKN